MRWVKRFLEHLPEIALWALVSAGLFLSLLASGCTYPPPQAPSASDSAVEVTSRCEGFAAGGSGVDTGAGVITALHVAMALQVVGCASPDIMVDGRPAELEVADVRADLALLSGPDGPRVPRGPAPSVGDKVCAHTARPERGSSCGEVTRVADTSAEVSFRVVPGNSGSGVYSAGKLIGIVTHRQVDGSGGRFSILASRPWAVR